MIHSSTLTDLAGQATSAPRLPASAPRPATTPRVSTPTRASAACWRRDWPWWVEPTPGRCRRHGVGNASSQPMFRRSTRVVLAVLAIFAVKLAPAALAQAKPNCTPAHVQVAYACVKASAIGRVKRLADAATRRTPRRPAGA